MRSCLTILSFVFVLLASSQAHAVTINPIADDADKSVSNGSTIEENPMRVGKLSGNEIAAVLVYQLPTSGAEGTFLSGSDIVVDSATLTAYRSGANHFSDIQLFGVRSDSSSTVQASDISGGTLLDAKFDSRDFDPHGFRSTSTAALVDWIELQLQTAGAGDYLFFRLAVDDLTGVNTNAKFDYRDAGHNANPDQRPSLTFEARQVSNNNPVPEPATAFLGVLGLAGLSLRWRRQAA